MNLYQALESIMAEIEKYEEEFKKEKRLYYKSHIKIKINWAFERGVKILQLSKKGELKPEVFDWFLGRTAKKPYDSQRQALEKIRKANVNGSWFDRFRD